MSGNLMNYNTAWAEEMKNICSSIGFNNPLMTKRMFYYQGIIQGQEVDYSKKKSFPVLKEAVREQNEFVMGKFNNLIRSGAEKNSEFKMRLAAAYSSIIKKQIAREKIIWEELHRINNPDADKLPLKEYTKLMQYCNQFSTLITEFMLDEKKTSGNAGTNVQFKKYLDAIDSFLHEITNQYIGGDELNYINMFQTFLISGEAYNILKNPVDTYFSRKQLLKGTIDTNIDYTMIADEFFKKILKKSRKKETKVEGQITFRLSKEFERALESGMTELFKSANGSSMSIKPTKTVSITSRGNKNHATQKKAFEEIIKQHYWQPLLADLEDGEMKTFEFKVKINKQYKTIKGVFTKEKFELQNADGTIIMRIGQQNFSLLQQMDNIPNKTYKGMGEFTTILYLSIEQAILKAMNSKSSVLYLANSDTQKQFLEWYRKKARPFFAKIFKNDDRAAKIYSNAGLNGLLHEINTAAISYFRMGFNDTNQKTSLLAAGGKNVDVKRTVSHLKGGAGFQSKGKIDEQAMVSKVGSVGPYIGESMKIYADSEISFMSTNVLSNYFGTDFAQIIQYLMVNTIPQQQILGNIPITFEEIQTGVERVAALRIPSFLRYSLMGEKSINDFYILNGRLIPSSIIIYLAYIQVLTNWGKTIDKVININLKKPDSGYTKYYMETESVYPDKMKNLVNAEILKRSKIKYNGLDVQFDAAKMF